MSIPTVLPEISELSPGDKIKLHLKRNGQTMVWLASELDLNRKHLLQCLNGDRPLTESTRQKINERLGTDY